MRSKSRLNASSEKDSDCYTKAISTSIDTIASYNQIISNYLQYACAQPQVCISNVGDGSLLLKATLSPFPPLTSLMTEDDWLKVMQKIKSAMHGNSMLEEVAAANSSTIVEGGSKTPLSDSGTNNLVDPIKDSPPPSPGKWSFSPTHECSPSSSPTTKCGLGATSSTHRRPLKVRFHRTGIDKYEVVASAAASYASGSLESISKQPNRRAHKKVKKAKKHRESSEFSHIAYMIDESNLIDDIEPILPPLTENGCSNVVVPNGNVHVKDLDCSLSKKGRNPTSMDAMAIWPAKSDDTFSGDDADAEASVTHHIWKKKQRRGEPVVKTSYVRRQGTPVTLTSSGIIKLRNRSRSASHWNESCNVDRRLLSKRRSRNSAPPMPSLRQRPWRATKSASPHCHRKSRYKPVYSDDDVLVCSPFMNTRSREQVKVDVPMIKEESIVETDKKTSLSENEQNDEHVSSKIVKQESENVQDGPLANFSTNNVENSKDIQQPARLLRKCRPRTQPKKIRPRAGRRTGERVTSDEELPPDDNSARKSITSSHHEDKSRSDRPIVYDDDLSVFDSRNDDECPLYEEKPEVLSEHSSTEAYKGSTTDGLYIDEEEAVDDKIEQNTQNQDQLREIFNHGKDVHCGEIKDEPLSIDDNSQTFTLKANYEMTEIEKEMVPENQLSELVSQRQNRRKIVDHLVDPSVSYRYRMWSHAYRTFRTNPFVVPPARGQVPQLVRYPRRLVREVRSVTRDEKCFVKLGVKYEVAVSNPPKEPNERNWKEIYVGDVLWVRWRKNEYWPATAYNISDTAPVKVTVLWINDKTQSTVDYTLVDSFDMAFHIRYDARRNDSKYVKAVATALRFMGKMGFWECHITAKVYDEIIKEEGEAFCRHILPEELQRIKEKSKLPKQGKETKKDDIVRRLFKSVGPSSIRAAPHLAKAVAALFVRAKVQNFENDQSKMQKSVEVLQALQAAHFIDIYQRSPLVGNALPLTQQIVDDYQGSKEYASGNLDPLFVDGSMLSFDEDVKVFDIDPEVMGSNEIVQWDGDSGMASSSCDTTDASLGSENPLDDSEVALPNANVSDVEGNDEEFPQPFSEIDALRLTSPEKLPPKKRHGARSVTPKPTLKKRRI